MNCLIGGAEVTIWKYQLKADDIQEIEIPVGSRILSLQVQNGIPCIWALVYDKSPKDTKKIYTFGTGEPTTFLPETLQFLGTYQILEGQLVFHVFID
jgi:hypothetical protein